MDFELESLPTPREQKATWRMPQHIDRKRLRLQWEDALAEDGFESDVTSLIAVDDKTAATARIVARQPGVFAGAVIFDLLKEAYDRRLTVSLELQDGDALGAGTEIATLVGPLRLMLGIERTLLNFLQRLCGIATVTRQYVDAVAGTGAKICDTRKTVPGWRQLDKYAVRCGRGSNHRVGLHDAILVKDNHLARFEPEQLADAATAMLVEAGSLNPLPDFIEFEVDTLKQLEELFKVTGIDVILLDNFTSTQMRKAVALRNKLGLTGKVALEASGNVNLKNVRTIAQTGVDRIAVGAITHSAPALDIAMEIEATT